MAWAVARASNLSFDALARFSFFAATAWTIDPGFSLKGDDYDEYVLIEPGTDAAEIGALPSRMGWAHPEICLGPTRVRGRHFFIGLQGLRVMTVPGDEAFLEEVVARWLSDTGGPGDIRWGEEICWSGGTESPVDRLRRALHFFWGIVPGWSSAADFRGFFDPSPAMTACRFCLAPHPEGACATAWTHADGGRSGILRCTRGPVDRVEVHFPQEGFKAETTALDTLRALLASWSKALARPDLAGDPNLRPPGVNFNRPSSSPPP